MLRPLETREEREKKIRKRNLILSILIAITILAGTIGWVMMGKETENLQKYKEFKFRKVENQWQTTVKVYNNNEFLIRTSFLPQEVENIPSTLEGLYLEKIYDKIIYFVVFSQTELQAAQELAINLYPFSKRIQLACSKEKENETFCADKPIKNCENGTESLIIILEEKNETKIKYEKNCLEIYGKGSEILKASDKVIFVIFGIIK
ncbi:MAG: hypothetical protein NZ889_01355 [Candidatus Pacearchaeota archaeon]|nr:hypothetical protein [Candidatus Pacearchaeota archaeon]